MRGDPGYVRPPLIAALWCLALSAAATAAAAPAASEWSSLRGPHHDGSAARESRFASGAGSPVVRWRTRIKPRQR